MGYTRDMWYKKVRQPGGSVKRVPTKRCNKGKRWQSVWHDEDGFEVTRLFESKEASDRNWKAMETDVDRGDYLDPRAAKTPVRAVAALWFASRDVDPSSMIRYEALWRLHVEPEFGRRGVGKIAASQIQMFLNRLKQDYGPSTAAGAYLVLQGILGLAVNDGLIKATPAQPDKVTRPQHPSTKVVAWSDERIAAIIDAHPDDLRLIPVLMAATGIRIGEAFALAVEDFDFENHVLHVRRQLKKLGSVHVFALPKNDLERDVPLSAWAEETVLSFVSRYPSRSLQLPWETPDGKLVEHKVLFRWPTDGSFVRYRLYSEQAWKPALAAAGVIPPPVLVTDRRNPRKTRRRFVTTRKEGPHQYRHYYASVMLADGASIVELAEYLGHSDSSITLQVYGHMQQGSHASARLIIDRRMNRLRKAAGDRGPRKGAGSHLRLVDPSERAPDA